MPNRPASRFRGQKHGRKDGEELQNLVGALRTGGEVDLHQGIDVMLHDDGMLVHAPQVLLQVVVTNRQRGIQRQGCLLAPLVHRIHLRFDDGLHPP
jgi:hypothetical protein